MPDENTNPVGTTQTSQNDQDVTNQSGDDFVLDFGDGENNDQDIKSEVEIDNLVDENKEEESSGGDDFDINLFGDDEKTKSLEDNNEIQDEEIKNEEFSNDSDNLPNENGEETIEENGEETTEENEEETIEENEEETIEENGEETIEENGEETIEENGEETIEENEEETIEENGEETIEENEEETIEENGEKTIEENGEETIEENGEETIEENGEETIEENGEETIEENGEETIEENGEAEDFTISLDEDATLVNDDSAHLDEKVDDEGNRVDTGIVLDELEGDKEQEIITEPEEKLDDAAGEDTNSHTYFGDDETESNPGKMEEFGEESANNDQNSVIDNAEPALKQPEIGDLLGDSSIDFSMQEQENDNVKTDNELTEISQPINNETENPNFLQEEKEGGTEKENQPVENEKESTNASVENQSFTLDYAESNGSEHEEITTNNAPETVVNAENSNITEANHTNVDANQVENVNQVESQQISTLSLDQILDTELINNPQIADKSTAVPVNITSNKGLLSSKKMTGVIAGVGVALMAGLVVVLAFPLNTSNGKNSPTDDEQIVEEYAGEHQVATSDESMEENPENNTKEEVEDLEGDTDIHSGRVTVQYDFPDTGWEEEGGDTSEGDGDSGQGEINPYVCDGDDCLYGGGNQGKTFEIGDILPIISDYRSQAEQYYSQGDEMQDKKLVKLSLKAIYLCNSYEEQVNNGESLDEESFSSFESKIEKLLDKMQNYLGGDDYESLQNNTKRNYFE